MDNEEVIARGTRTPPKFCPGCGAALRDTRKSRAAVPVGPPLGRLLVQQLEPEHPWGWDCYCVTCSWSGDISPDEKSD